MQVSKLLDDDAGVSPVIGVILMVAITVILAAVIGTFVLNNNNLNDTAAQANWDYSYDSAGNKVTVTHEGGDDIEESNIKVAISTVEDADLDGGSTTPDLVSNADSTISAGSSFTLEDPADDWGSGDELRIIWTSPEGGSSSTIGTYEVP